MQELNKEIKKQINDKVLIMNADLNVKLFQLSKTMDKQISILTNKTK